MHASKSFRGAVAGFEARFHAGAIPPQVPPQFAPSPDFESGGTTAKRPAAGPTSRLLRVLLHQRLDDWRHRVMDECRDVPGPVGPVLDESELKEFCANLSLAEAREFVWLCIVDTELRLTDIVARRAAGDLEGVAEIAHRIAREAARLGAVRVHVLALRLETASRSTSAGTCSLIGELSDAWTEVGDTMCAWLARQAGSAAAV